MSKSQQKVLLISLAVVIVALFLVNLAIKQMMDETSAPAVSAPQVKIQQRINQSEETGSQNPVAITEDLPQGAALEAQKPADVSPQDGSQEIIYEPSIKDNVLIQ